MTAQDLSPDLLQICAALYATENSVLFDRQIFYGSDGYYDCPEVFDTSIFGWTIYAGTWYDRPFYAVHISMLTSLKNSNLLTYHEERGYVFYTLNICEEHKEFFKELGVQVALGSIDIDLENV